MGISLLVKSVAGATYLLFLTTASYGQYGGGGYGGGYGGGGYGNGMGGMGRGMAGAGANFKPSMPNIAGELAAKETKWMKEHLDLTKDQAKSIKTLNNDYAKLQQEAIKEIVGADGGKSNPNARQQVQDAMIMYNEEKEDKFKTILTKEQWVMYQTKKPDMQREIGGFRPPTPKELMKVDSAAATKQ